jgi:hypothetical protein
MSIFGKIMSVIFGSSASAQGSGGGVTGATLPGGSTPLSGIDVEAVVAKLAETKKEKLDWKHSIVDLMKVLDLDSSFAARKQLAQELKYSGDMNDSASMNIWLHKQVMQKLAENGGKVSPDMMKK